MGESMPRLLLLRHAKSRWDDPELADHERPLAPRGWRATEIISGHLRARGFSTELVLCSSAERARETLAGIADALGDAVEVEIDDGIYGASERELRERVRRIDDDTGSAMVIGHNPGIGELAVDLAGSGEALDEMRAKFPTAALATLEWEGSWSALAPGAAALVDFVTPKLLAARG